MLKTFRKYFAFAGNFSPWMKRGMAHRYYTKGYDQEIL